jgi:pSer/pThr/pTyr-binding forkhead associated (FHA) protein
MGHDLAVLSGARYCIGKRADADPSITTDAAVSGMHALLEPAGATWCVRDLGSRNGTFVNGERLFGERVLRDGDEITVGRTRLVFRDEVSGDAIDDGGVGGAAGVDAAGAGRAGGVVSAVVVGQRVHAAGVGARDR